MKLIVIIHYCKLLLFLLLLSTTGSYGSSDKKVCRLDRISCLAKDVIAEETEILFPDKTLSAIGSLAFLIEPKNTTTNYGDNVTLECACRNCEIFWYYLRTSDFSTITIDDFIPIYTPIELNRNELKYEHEKRSIKDPNINFKTVNEADKQYETLKILNITENDLGPYACILANGESYRLSISYVNLTPPKIIDHFTNEIVTNSTSSYNKTKKADKLNLLSIGLVIFISVIIFAIILLSIFACLHLKYQKNLCKCCCWNLFNGNKNDKMFFKGDPHDHHHHSSAHGSLQKGFQAMKHNLLYPYTPNSFIGINSNDVSSSKRSYYINDVLIMPNSNQTNNEKLLLNYSNSISNLIYDPTYASMVQQLIDDKNYLIPFENVSMGKKIGEGAFGIVYCAQTKDDNEKEPNVSKTVAVKVLKENANFQEVKNFIQEIEIMKSVGKHENIVTLLGISTNPTGALMAIVEYAKHGNLRDYLRNKRIHSYFVFNLQRNINAKNHISNLLTLLSSSTSSHDKEDESIDFRDLVNFAYQIALGMDYLHSKKLLHRDLAARNVLVCENRTVKIADFGLARDIEQNYYYKRQTDGRLPVKWMAPECLFDRKAYTNSDIWSYGILLWEIFSLGGTPYPSVPVEKLYDYLKQGNRMSKPAYANNDIYNLMLRCWNQNALKRPSFKETSVFLNTQLQKLSKTISSISSFSSINSHSELKKLNYDINEFRANHNHDQNNEADDEHTAEAFLNLNDNNNDKLINEKKIEMYFNEEDETNNQNESTNNKNFNRKLQTRSLGDASTQDSQYFSGNCDDTTSSLMLDIENLNHDFDDVIKISNSNKISENDEYNDKIDENGYKVSSDDQNDQKNLYELITRLNLNSNKSINNDTNNIINNNNNNNKNDVDNFTDSNYESASSYYSTTSPNHINDQTSAIPTSLQHMIAQKTEACDNSTDYDSPLISAKSLLVRMSYDKPFYMNNNNGRSIKYQNEILDNGPAISSKYKPSSSLTSSSSTSSASSKTMSAPKILISPSIDDEDYDEFVN